ncbi:MAG TPA: adenylate/guanylate cyclase domain-containing protein [Casimicrobiaceae bacterium]|nr:adenylate/guanylate cyclase domain-containing protein [Casimicrobiaceae bacterium]
MRHDIDDRAQVAASIRRALADGLNTLALDLAREARDEAHERPSPEIDYLGALASIRIGAVDEGEAWLNRVDVDRLDDRALAAEALSLGGRIAKDRYVAMRGHSPEAAREQALIAIDRYRRSYAIDHSPYRAVNAATMARVIGDHELARQLANETLAAAKQTSAVAHWHHATRAEALLLLDRLDEAADAYRLAREAAGVNFGDVASMRRQLMLIGSPAAHDMLEHVRAPLVIAFSGHMIDRAGRRSERFPPSLEPVVDEALRAKLASYGEAIGFSQAACGADILFLEALQDAGMQSHVVLPCAVADFIATSVAFAGERWVARFERALARATSTLLATEEPLLGDHVLFEHASELIHGLARLRANELCTRLMMLTLLDPSTHVPRGGTGASAAAWQLHGNPIETIDLSRLRGSKSAPTLVVEEESAVATDHRVLKSLLFADVQGFSRVPDHFTPRFADIFLGTCKRLLDQLETHVDASTRGDGIFLVFDDASDAARFAISLQTALTAVDWTSLRLPANTSARIGLHTGPVFATFDPVMNKPTWYGTHVNRAARLEPVVQPGQIFMTEAFAATLTAQDDGRYACHYIGSMPLAKAFGDARLYRLSTGSSSADAT